MQNVNLVPRAYEVPVIKICNNLRKHTKQESSSLIEHKHFL